MIQKDRKPARRKAAPKTPAAAARTGAAAAKPAAKPATTAAAVPGPAAVAALVVKNHTEVPVPQPVSAEERARMIAEAAYFRAQRRGFQGGDPVRDWAEAEAEIDAMLLHRG